MNDATDTAHPLGVRWPDIQIPVGSPVVVGRSSSCTVRMPHVSVGRRHAQFSWSGPLLEIVDLDSRFGTLVNGVRIRQAVLKRGDTVRIGSSPPYRFNGEMLRAELDGQGMAIDLHDVSVVRGGAKRLDGISMHIPAGSFIGIIGPSGAGKSLLLGCLSSTIEPSEGHLTFDNLLMHEHLDYYRSRIGFVTQADLIDHSLTAHENLHFAAQIRHPDSDSSAIRKMVETGLLAVGLQADRDKLAARLSGGQQKRLSVAIELLLTPRLLLLDEPTSGLDPHRQANVMDMLRRLSRQGITVACSTHTLDTLHYLDRVVVLGLKNNVAVIVYDGEPDRLLPEFGVRTTTDLFDRLVGVERMTTAPVEKFMPPQDVAAGSSPHPHTSEQPAIVPSRRSVTSGHIARQSWIVLRKSLVSLRRDRMSTLLALVQPVALASLVVLSQQNQPRSAFVHFFVVLSAFWLGMTLTVREIVKERKLYVRDRLACLVPSAYLTGKVLYAMLLVAVQSLLLAGAARLLVPFFIPLQSLHETVRTALLSVNFCLAWSILFLVGCGGALVGFLISTLATSERAAVALLPLALLPQVLLSRVAIGDGGHYWGEVSPIGIIGKVSAYFATKPPFQSLLVFFGSVPMITRPGAAVLDLLARTDPSPGAATDWMIECAYLGLLLMAYLLCAVIAFRWAERKWDSLLR